MCTTGHDARSTFFLKHFSGFNNRSCGVDHIVHQDNIFTRHVADDVHHFRLIGFFTAFIDNDHIDT